MSIPTAAAAAVGAGAAATAGLPVVNQALEPAWVRDGSTSTQKAYESALSFEQTLVEQLSQSLTTTSGLESESSSAGEAESDSAEEGALSTDGAGDSQLSSLLPQALSSGVMHAGGLGLAAQMTRDLEGVDSTVGRSDTAARTRANGGTSA
jgi:hypothetical protein